MVTFAQAQERAEEWINGDVPGYQHREVRVREFDLGFVVWAEDRQDGPVSDGGAQRLVIARDSGEATLWPSLPVGEVIRRYEEEYGLPDAAPQDAAPPPVERVDLNQTSFLLSPPEWLQEAADKMGIPDRRSGTSAADSDSDSAAGTGAGAGEASGAGSPAPPAPTDAGAPLPPAAPGGGTPWPEAGGQGDDDEPAWDDSLAATSAGTPAGATPWAGTDTNADPAEDHSVPLPATVFSPPLSSLGEDDTPPPGVAPDAKTALMHGGSHLPATAIAPALDGPATPAPSAYRRLRPRPPARRRLRRRGVALRRTAIRRGPVRRGRRVRWVCPALRALRVLSTATRRSRPLVRRFRRRGPMLPRTGIRRVRRVPLG